MHMTDFDPFAAQIFRGNDFVSPREATTQAIPNPATLEAVGKLALTPNTVVDDVTAEAFEAHKAWARVDYKSRAALLHAVADHIEKNPFHDVARLMSLEMGKPYPEAEGELYNVAPAFRYFAEMARDEAGQVAGTTQAGSFQYSRYEPYGV